MLQGIGPGRGQAEAGFRSAPVGAVISSKSARARLHSARQPGHRRRFGAVWGTTRRLRCIAVDRAGSRAASSVTVENRASRQGAVRAIAMSDRCRCVSTPRWARTSWKVTSTLQRRTNHPTICAARGSCQCGPELDGPGQAGHDASPRCGRQGHAARPDAHGANCHDSHMLAATLDAVPGVRTGRRGRPQRRPDKLHVNKGYDHRRCRCECRARSIRLRCWSRA